eukprot:CAMPEP_0119110706 /NCGR_PEP_ID=MMETSP1180-20130426/31588_1 /TAXON_ID=3052 ORGANISM="Chlamydomonas cf sp, Strain CCMP681" /NCGR_SAMPLE_ID=MMETSP1180 /ASSEMBLY_ACC=CAM_ASM_000741 /LENGTH=108 /DNA_ID=CAMNT_0007097219 /DNA_START=186 /DNA_END=508 /DNA_ORIENTATION=+
MSCQQLCDNPYRQGLAPIPQRNSANGLEVRILLQAHAPHQGHLHQGALTLEKAPGPGLEHLPCAWVELRDQGTEMAGFSCRVCMQSDCLPSEQGDGHLKHQHACLKPR